MSVGSDAALEKVTDIISGHLGLNAGARRAAEAEPRIRRAMSRAQVTDASRYLALIERQQLPLDDLVAEFTVGESYFFRDPQHFEFLRREVVPDVRRRRGRDHALRIWSAGCAAGEEAYSLAMTLDEDGLAGHVLATDVSRAALGRARDATYRRWSLRGVPDATVARCFHASGNRWKVDDRFRTRVSFAWHNLVQSACPSIPAGIWGMDLIVCRNVLIYLDQAAVQRAAHGFAGALADGGWLMTGPSDPLLSDTSLAAEVTGGGIVYRKRTVSCTLPATPRLPPAPAVTPLPAEEPHRPPGTGPIVPVLAAAAPVLASEAQAALAAGDYERVLRLTESAEDARDAAVRVRALVQCHGPGRAVIEVAAQVRRHPASATLHMLHAMLLMDIRRDPEAAAALRRVLYLDRSLAVAHYLLGTILQRQGGRTEEARRAFRRARNLARSVPAGEPLPLGDGAAAGKLAAAADAELARLDAPAVRAS